MLQCFDKYMAISWQKKNQGVQAPCPDLVQVPELQVMDLQQVHMRKLQPHQAVLDTGQYTVSAEVKITLSIAAQLGCHYNVFPWQSCQASPQDLHVHAWGVIQHAKHKRNMPSISETLPWIGRGNCAGLEHSSLHPLRLRTHDALVWRMASNIRAQTSPSHRKEKCRSS